MKYKEISRYMMNQEFMHNIQYFKGLQKKQCKNQMFLVYTEWFVSERFLLKEPELEDASNPMHLLYAGGQKGSPGSGWVLFFIQSDYPD